MSRFAVYTDVGASSANLETRLSALPIPTDQSIYNVKAPAYGAVGNGSADDTAAINAAIAALPATGGIVYFPAGTYKVTSTLAITKRGVRFVGVRDGRVTQGGGSRIAFAPTSQATPVACIKLGTSGVANDPFYDASYDSNNYGGPQEFYVENMSFEYTGSTNTTLDNGVSTYGTNTVAIRDFMAGDVRLRNVWFEHFQYGFWGVQSDFDHIENCRFLYCHVGAYFGPRSDQLVTIGMQGANNDTTLWHDRSANANHIGFRSIGCGAAGVGAAPHVKLGSQYTAEGSHDIIFVAPWFEQEQNSYNVEAFVEIGGGSDPSSIPTRDITILRPTILTNTQVTTPHCQYLARLGHATRIFFDHWGNGTLNLSKHFLFTHATTNAHVEVSTHDDLGPTYDNTGAATPVVSWRATGYGQHTLAGVNGRLGLYYSNQASNYANNMILGSESQFSLQAYFPNKASGDTSILKLLRRVQNAAAAPAQTNFSTGDLLINQAPAVGSAALWHSLNGGSGSTMTPLIVTPGSSADKGDASVTIVPGTDPETIRFDTNLTANRTVTLSTTGAWNGAKFTIVRTGLGAFTLDVGGLKTIPSATAAYVDVEYNGTAWKLKRYGTL